MKYFSMFSGIGGFEYGIERAFDNSGIRTEDAGEDNKEAGCSLLEGRNQKGGHRATCVGFSEIDKYATAIYQYHFPKHRGYGDAFKIDPGTIPDFDLLCGGFPCQAFSIAGKRVGFEDTRGTLFFEIARIVAVKRPSLLLLENVKGLLSHDNGRTFGTILSTLSDLGYFLEWQVLNSKDFGVPQNRERVFIVGHLGGIGRGQVFPIGECDGLSEKSYGKRSAENQHSTAITSNYRKGVHSGGETYAVGTLRTHKDGQGFRELSSGNSPTIPARAREDGSGMPVIAIPDTTRIRRLTPTECERLQAFPDGWTKFGRFGNEVKEISDSQRYKCLGNSVTTTVVAEIVNRIKQS